MQHESTCMNHMALLYCFCLLACIVFCILYTLCLFVTQTSNIKVGHFKVDILRQKALRTTLYTDILHPEIGKFCSHHALADSHYHKLFNNICTCRRQNIKLCFSILYNLNCTTKKAFYSSFLILSDKLRMLTLCKNINWLSYIENFI